MEKIYYKNDVLAEAVENINSTSDLVFKQAEKNYGITKDMTVDMFKMILDFVFKGHEDSGLTQAEIISFEGLFTSLQMEEIVKEKGLKGQDIVLEFEKRIKELA